MRERFYAELAAYHSRYFRRAPVAVGRPLRTSPRRSRGAAPPALPASCVCRRAPRSAWEGTPRTTTPPFDAEHFRNLHWLFRLMSFSQLYIISPRNASDSRAAAENVAVRRGNYAPSGADLSGRTCLSLSLDRQRDMRCFCVKITVLRQRKTDGILYDGTFGRMGARSLRG